MRFRVKELRLRCGHEKERVVFRGFNYFHGPIGGGKTTIAKLIDFCLGADFQPTPILQPIFSGADLDLEIENQALTLSRDRGSAQVRAQWDERGEPVDLVVPARKSGDVVLPGTEIAVLSDLIFHLAGTKPPRVRKSKQKEDSDLVRLSMRDILMFCYLDQDSMDSSFFALDEHAHPFVKLKSLDVLRFIVGFHQEKVSELEAELAALRLERIRCEGAEQAIRDAFKDEQLSTSEELDALIRKGSEDLVALANAIDAARTRMTEVRTHAADRLRQEGRGLAEELSQLDEAISDLQKSIEKDKSHRNTIRHLAVRQRRSVSARAELAGIGFSHCPQCFQHLPSHPAGSCSLCGQAMSNLEELAVGEDVIDADAKARADELDERIAVQVRELEKLRRQAGDLRVEKERIDYDLNQASQNYDSAYLSTYLDLEKRQSRAQQQIREYQKLKGMAGRVDLLRQKVAELEASEARVRSELRRERELAEKDRTNVELLEELFKDCLLRASLPGIYSTDEVKIEPPHFLPEVQGQDAGNLVTTTFANMSSGGKKNLFKCCFALAIHRLARKNNALLPQFIIIDSPMKNISERENRQQFVGFNQMLYELAAGELAGTQFIVMDKEFVAPPKDVKLDMLVRHMTPDDPQVPPLLRNHLSPRQDEG